jgi:hypothetical protein
MLQPDQPYTHKPAENKGIRLTQVLAAERQRNRGLSPIPFHLTNHQAAIASQLTTSNPQGNQCCL